MLTPSEEAHAGTLLLHPDSKNMRLGWTLLRPHPLSVMRWAREVFVLAFFSKDEGMRSDMYEALLRYMPQGRLRTWREGLALFRVEPSDAQCEHADQPAYFPELWAAYERVAPLFETLLVRYPPAREPYLRWVKGLGKLGRAERAVAWCLRLLAVEPNHADCLTELYWLYRIDLQQLIPFARWVETFFRCSEHGLLLSPVLYLQLLRPDKAVALYLRMDWSDTPLPDKREFSLLHGYAQMGAWEACRPLLAQLPERPIELEHDDVLLAKATVAAQQGSEADFLRCCNRLLERPYNQTNAHGLLGRFYSKQQRFAEARALYEQALLQCPNAAHPLLSPLLIALLVHPFQELEAAATRYRDWQILPAYANLAFDLSPSERADFERAVYVLEQQSTDFVHAYAR